MLGQLSSLLVDIRRRSMRIVIQRLGEYCRKLWPDLERGLKSVCSRIKAISDTSMKTTLEEGLMNRDDEGQVCLHTNSDSWRTSLHAVLLGPLQAVSYILQHGCTAWALGTGWHLRLPWWLSTLLASIVRMLGTIGFLAFTSWTLNENVYRLLVTQIHSLVVSSGIQSIMHTRLYVGRDIRFMWKGN